MDLGDICTDAIPRSRSPARFEGSPQRSLWPLRLVPGMRVSRQLGAYLLNKRTKISSCKQGGGGLRTTRPCITVARCPSRGSSLRPISRQISYGV